MKHSSKKILSVAVAAAIYAPMAAWATNGMNLEGYGPIALGMGGASMAYDNGTAAVMNNPATLGLMGEGARLDAALGFLGPDVTATVTTPGGDIDAKSDADAFYMPAIGYARKSGQITYGVGMFAQGGMGTEYAADTWMADPSQGANSALTSGLVNRSEVGVGRLIAPLAFEVNNKLVVAGSIDFVWAGMDIIMAMSSAQFEDLVTTQNGGTASGSFTTAFGSLYEPFGGTGVQTLYHAQFDFSNDSDFTGKAFGTGFAGKLGVTYKVNQQLTVGATYHSKTSLDDLTTSDATVRVAGSFDDNILNGTVGTAGFAGTYSDAIIPVSGKIAVKDFQWPATMGVGAAFQASDKLMIVADVKRIKWADVMKDFNMVFTADNVASNGGFAGLELDATLFQKWKDQTVIQLGGAYKVNDALTVRAGFNRASNPIPDAYLNALFPAIVENHVTLGVGYAMNSASSVDFALSRASEVSATNPGNGSTVPPVESTHSQLSWQVMYSHRF
jgi:long-chain fatty acid transport protein